MLFRSTLQMKGLYTIAGTILDWAKEKGSNAIVILDSVGSDAHDNEAYCAAEEDMCRVMADKNIKIIPHGFVTGIAGGILNECLIREIKGIALLARANAIIPDPEAAATLIEAVNRLYEMKIDTADLKKEKERITAELEELSKKYLQHKKEESSDMYM